MYAGDIEIPEKDNLTGEEINRALTYRAAIAFVLETIGYPIPEINY